MRIEQQNVLELLGTPGARFTIPKFQRRYSWDDQQCDELWRDIARAARGHRAHFLGTLIYLSKEEVFADRDGELSIVDGQQRLTTITLILTALARHLRTSGEELFGINERFITESYLKDEGHAKLSLSSEDRATLEAVVMGKELPANPAERIVSNLNNFQQKMGAEDFDARELMTGLGQLFVIEAQLESREQAPVVFESFNSKGMPLVTADLVRNYLLLAESHDEQARLYEKYWEPISGVFGDDPGSIRLNNAILGWLAVRFSKVRKFGDDQAFSIFKSFCEDEYDGSIDDLLEELYAFCMVWAENYRYHSVKKYKTADWATLGHKTRVSNRPRAKLDNPESYEYYKRHFGVDPQW